jgi:hypothetical protein
MKQDFSLVRDLSHNLVHEMYKRSTVRFYVKVNNDNDKPHAYNSFCYLIGGNAYLTDAQDEVYISLCMR